MRRLAFALIVVAVTVVAIYSTASGDSPGAGNDFYHVSVEDRAGRDGLGVFTIGTGPGHPEGDGREILFAEDAPGDAATSYITVRSYTTGTDYVQTRRGPGSSNLVVGLDAFGSVEPRPDGYRTAYDLAAAAQPDPLRIVSKVTVGGATYEQSVVRLTTALTNTGDFPLTLGVRYLLDFSLYGDDGPVLLTENGPRSVEQSFSPVPATVQMRRGSSEQHPMAVRSESTDAAPDAMKYASWSNAFEFAWDYTSKGRDIATDGGLNDAALLYYFGSTPATALHLDPGESVVVALELASGPPEPSPTPTPSPSPASTSGTPTPSPSATPLRTPAALPRTGRR
jgi:hypothetical protein